MKLFKRKTKAVEEPLEELSAPELEEIVDNKAELDGANDSASNDDFFDISSPIAEEESASDNDYDIKDVEATEVAPNETESELEPQADSTDETDALNTENSENSGWYDGSSNEVFEKPNEPQVSEENSVVEPDENVEEIAPSENEETIVPSVEEEETAEFIVVDKIDDEVVESIEEPQQKEVEQMNDVNLKTKECNIEKTVVDTVIVNNMVSSSKVSSNEVEKAHEYSVEELTVPDAKKDEMVLAKGEKVVKVYNVVKSAHTGNAIVTNRRLIVDSDYRVDVPLEKIGCVTSARYNKVKVVNIIIGVLFIAICAFALIFDFNKYIPDNLGWLCYLIVAVGALFGVIGIILIATSFRKRFALNIYTEDLYPVMAVSSRIRRKDGDLIGSIVTAGKGKDFDRFTLEIGGLLIQLKDALKEKK